MAKPIFTDEIAEFVRSNYEGIGPAEMARILNDEFKTNYSKQQLKSYYANHNLNSGLTGYFEKGHVPFNKGRKGMHAAGSEKTWFKKGHTPANHKPVDSERISKDGYIEIKVAEPNKWMLKHRFIWEKKNGPLPKGMIIRFLDGNKLNCNIENMVLVSRAEHIEITRNNLHSCNPEVSKIGVNIAKLNCAVRDRGNS